MLVDFFLHVGQVLLQGFLSLFGLFEFILGLAKQVLLLSFSLLHIANILLRNAALAILHLAASIGEVGIVLMNLAAASFFERL
jgi:hypothetical protein